MNLSGELVLTVSCEIELTLANTHKNKQTSASQQFSYSASQLQESALPPRILLVPRFIFYVYNIIMYLTSLRYTLFSHCNCMGDRTPHWAYAKHPDTLHVLLTNTHNVYPRSTRLIIINIIMPTELSQYTMQFLHCWCDVVTRSHVGNETSGCIQRTLKSDVVKWCLM